VSFSHFQILLPEAGMTIVRTVTFWFFSITEVLFWLHSLDMMNIVNRIEINSGLDDFVLLDRISEIGAATIAGKKKYFNDPAYLGIESLAQLGAYHVRFLTGFENHAFLLKINQCAIPANHILNGSYLLKGTLVSQSKSAFCYELQAGKGNKVQIEGEFLYATIDYDRMFNKKILQAHYRKVFSCLQKESKTDC